ncbi:transcriptional regulator, MarR family [Chitinophaga sp. CF118]|uniref:MarR family winged helix-turn-helix transcriptional regulator n=1 Tax=Chitinophaga sp. CF118 TaxID=1884367 RepID=UPI0008EBDE5B|nr:winged helix DNA-binding protein [Chitinophaga sp. CF118]SFE07827.1 transcriptional regulator, MarR family [Chitinophaga sp. CF118]
MNKTVELVNQWGAFEENHPDGNIEDFCRHYLASREKQKEKGPLVGGVVPGLIDGLLLKIIGRIHKLNASYANMALKETDLNQIEEFGVLLTIQQEKNPKKTEVIYANLFELSSGTDMLNRLKNRGLIEEYDDIEDKRSKRIELTAKGVKAIEGSYLRIKKMATMMLHDLTNDDKELCIQLLKNVEIKFSALWQKHRGKEFDDVYKEIIG